MSISLAPPSPGGGGAFILAAWNIRCGCNAGMTSGAKGLAQLGIGLAVLTETNLTDDRHPRLANREATSHNQGGITLLWQENHAGYEGESAHITMPNLLTFTGDKGFYCMGIYTLLT